MSILNNSLLLTAPAGGAATAGRSIRLNAPDSAYLSRTPASSGNRKTWTWSAWIKRSKITSGDYQFVFSAIDSGATAYTALLYSISDDALSVWDNQAGIAVLRTSQVFRDASAWFHVVWSVDTTQATASNRMKLYVNGSEVTAWATDARSSITQNLDLTINRGSWPHSIGSQQPYAGRYFDGYLTLVHFIDGQALTPSSFGETSATTGQWIAKTYSGSYGTNGFFLDFADNSTAAALGYDAAGSNDWTVNNLVVSGTTVTGKTTPYLTYGTSDPYILFNGTTSPIASGSWPTDNTYLGHGQTSSFVDSSVITFSPPITAGSNIYVYANRQSSGGNIVVNVGLPSETTVTIPTTGWAYTSTGVSTIYNIQMKASTSGSNVLAGLQFFSTTNNSSGRITSTPANNIDSLRDHPTSAGTNTQLGGEVSGNYCTLNPLAAVPAGASLSNGNLDGVTPTNGLVGITGTIAIPSSGKWYWEVTGTSGSAPGFYGIAVAYNYIPGVIYYGTGDKYVDGSSSAYGASYGTSDVIGIAVNVDSGTITFYKNNVSQGSISYAASAGLFPYFCDGAGGVTNGFTANFGQRAWAYACPSGFAPLVDTLLPTPTIAKPNTVMDVVTYTGSSGGGTFSIPNFEPDLLWSKNRVDSATNHILQDAVRGFGNNKSLYSNLTDSESGTGNILSVSGSTVTYGTNSNFTGSTVTWTWDAGSSNATNTSGTITSTVRANISAGFSIITLTTPASTGNYSVGHGLGIKPAFTIWKSRTTSGNYWFCQHQGLGNMVDYYIRLESTAAGAYSAGRWVNEPTSSLLYTNVGNTWNTSDNLVCYAWAPVAGYSAFGSYTGNGSATDAPFIHTGFRPKLTLVKANLAGEHWSILDSSRNSYNPTNLALRPNLSSAEGTEAVDFLSNGFKPRNAGGEYNVSGVTYIYCAWAEAPFPYARAR